MQAKTGGEAGLQTGGGEVSAVVYMASLSLHFYNSSFISLLGLRMIAYILPTEHVCVRVCRPMHVRGVCYTIMGMTVNMRLLHSV